MPRLTRRGRAVVAVCVLATIMAWAFGARSLNAVVLPGVIALVAAYLQVRQLETPGVDRRLPPDDFVGATHAVELEFRDPDYVGDPVPDPFLADVSDAVSVGLDGPDEPTRTTVGEAPVTYEVTYTARGERTFGPVTLTAIDVFGLLERELLCLGEDRVTVYPQREPVPGWFRRRLYSDEDVGPSRQRDEFDRLREYARGDALRDVHWPTTAKRDELVVKEFAAESEQRRVRVSGGARGDAADELATAATSVALALLEDGVPVTVSLPNGRAAVHPGPEERRRLLQLLAFTTRGAVPDPDADVVIESDRTGTDVTVEDRTIAFERLVAEAEGEAAPAEARGPERMRASAAREGSDDRSDGFRSLAGDAA